MQNQLILMDVLCVVHDKTLIWYDFPLCCAHHSFQFWAISLCVVQTKRTISHMVPLCLTNQNISCRQLWIILFYYLIYIACNYFRSKINDFIRFLELARSRSKHMGNVMVLTTLSVFSSQSDAETSGFIRVLDRFSRRAGNTWKPVVFIYYIYYI